MMTTHLTEHLPIEVIFNLLCVCRRGFAGSPQSLRSAIYRRGLLLGAYRNLPRLPFWIGLCRSASLLDESWPPYPTLVAADWFAYPLENQIWTLVRAWVSTPRRKGQRQLRERLLDRLLAGAELSQTYLRELTGLRAIGVCKDNHLSVLGWRVLGEHSKPPSHGSRASPWSISGKRLQVLYPPRWDLIWQLEVYLEPVVPGVYSLAPASLRKAAQRGALDGLAEPALIAILEKGLGQPPPAELVERVIATPKLRVLPGPVLEFDDPHELLHLREMASFRQDLQQILSPRHVHLNPWQAHVVLKRLYRLGLLSEKDLDIQPLSLRRSLTVKIDGEKGTGVDELYLSRADRVYLLSLMLFAEGLKALYAPPPGLLGKLTAGLDLSHRGAAARKASKLLEMVFPKSEWIPEEELPSPPEEELIVYLEQAIAREESIDVLYKARGRSMPEYRHLTPLLVEQRGPRYYLIAYCHTRRANRTFRLDRLRLIDHPPEL
jgi:hypothetical protein